MTEQEGGYSRFVVRSLAPIHISELWAFMCVWDAFICVLCVLIHAVSVPPGGIGELKQKRRVLECSRMKTQGDVLVFFKFPESLNSYAHL